MFDIETLISYQNGRPLLVQPDRYIMELATKHDLVLPGHMSTTQGSNRHTLLESGVTLKKLKDLDFIMDNNNKKFGGLNNSGSNISYSNDYEEEHKSTPKGKFCLFRHCVINILDMYSSTMKRRKLNQRQMDLPSDNILSPEQMEQEKAFLKSQYDFPPVCNDFIIIYENSVKFNK